MNEIHCAGCGNKIFKPLIRKGVIAKVSNGKRLFYCDVGCLINPSVKNGGLKEI
jgi:hypothetical protein